MNNTEAPAKKIDTELLKVIDDAMAHSKDDTEALNKVLDFLKVHREMKGWHVSVDPDFAAKPDMDMATKTKTLAHEVLMMFREEALGRLEKVDLEELDRRLEDNEFCPKVLEEIRVPRQKKDDPELVKVIDDAIAGSKNYREALDKVLRFKGEHRGLKGISATVIPDSSAKPDASKKYTDDTYAHDILMMMRSEALGRFKDVTSETL